MAWAKLDDAMPHHPKVMMAGPQAFALDVAAICYSNRFGCDGFIADEMLPAVLPSLASPKKWAGKLVQAGRWVREDGGWQIHDIDDYQPTAVEQEEERAAARERMRNLRANRRRTPPSSSSDVRANTQRTNGERSPDVRNPVPSRPDVPDGTKPPSGASRSQGKRLPDDWRPDPEPELVKVIGGQQAAAREWAKFRDYWHAKPGKDGRKVDWQATWRNWLRRAAESGPARASPSSPASDVTETRRLK